MSQLIRTMLCITVFLVSGCSSLYFKTLDNAPVVPGQNPGDWPWQEYWTGIVFNGEKIGFSRLGLKSENKYIRISSEASLRLRFLMIDKQLALVSEDWVDPALQLERFEYEYKIDNSRRVVKGFTQDKALSFVVGDGNHFEKQQLVFEGMLVPMSALYVYPVMRGLEVGKVYRFNVFDGESLSIHPVRQEIVAFQSSELFEGHAFKVETELMGLSTEVWIGTNGLPKFELSLNGVMIAALENEHEAKRYLAQAALSKKDHLLSFSLVPVNRPLQNPRNTSRMKIRLEGVPYNYRAMNSADQVCNRENDGWICVIHSYSGDEVPGDRMQQVNKNDYLASSFTVNSNANEIIEASNRITVNATTDEERIMRILEWMNVNIEKQAIDSFNSLDVFELRKAECQGHSQLFAAFARSLGIPARLLNGVVYSKEHEGFLYHTWVESYIDGRWQAIDPTLGQRHADATHIALFEGETLAELTPLISLIGKLNIELLE